MPAVLVVLGAWIVVDLLLLALWLFLLARARRAELGVLPGPVEPNANVASGRGGVLG